MFLSLLPHPLVDCIATIAFPNETEGDTRRPLFPSDCLVQQASLVHLCLAHRPKRKQSLRSHKLHASTAQEVKRERAREEASERQKVTHYINQPQLTLVVSLSLFACDSHPVQRKEMLLNDTDIECIII